MKKFKVIWYRGSVEVNPDKEDVMKVIEVEANSIDDVGVSSILSDNILKKSYYVRGILWDDKTRTYDYGSYSEFVRVEEI